MPDHQHHALPFCGVDELQAFRCTKTQRLFAEHVLAGFYCGLAEIEVARRGRGDNHGIDGRIVEHRAMSDGHLHMSVHAGHMFAPYFMRVVINGTVAILLVHWASQTFPEGTIAVLASKPLWMQVLALLLVLDFFFYVMHRLKHHWQWWWRLHETHHSSMDLDWPSTVRFHPLEKVLDRLIFLLPLLVLGVSDQALLIWASLTLSQPQVKPQSAGQP